MKEKTPSRGIRDKTKPGKRCCWLSELYHRTEGRCPRRAEYGPYCEMHACLLGVRG